MLRNYKLLLFSFILLNLLNWINWVEFKYGIPQIVKYILSVFVFSTIIYYRLTKPSKLVKDDLFYPVIIWFLIWSLVLLLSSLLQVNNIIYLQRIFADRFFFIPYLLPLVILYIKFDLVFFKYLFRYAYLLMFPVVLIEIFILLFNLSPADWLKHMEAINIFNIGSSFLLLTAHLSKRRAVSTIVIIYYLLFIILALVYGRRGIVIMILLLLIAMLYLRMRSKVLKLEHRIKIYLIGLLILVLIPILANVISSSYAFERGFSKKGFDESRGLVFRDFYDDFDSVKDWIFGRGIDGRIYRSILTNEETLDIVEHGYLTVILRGGLLYLVPFIFILLRAAYLGILHSNNDLVKALSILILIHMIMMFYFNLPEYSTNYIFIWISVGVCLTPSIRSQTNHNIFKALNF